MRRSGGWATVLRKKLRESLTARIFCVTSLILLAASAVTFGIIALATPMTYASIASDRLRSRSVTLAGDLEGVPFDESGPLLDRFILDTQARVAVVNEDGEILDTPSNLTTGADEEMAGVVVTSVTVSSDDAGPVVLEGTASEEDGGGWLFRSESDSVTAAMEAPVWDSGDSVSVSVGPLSYTFTFQDWDRPCTLYISPQTEKVNPTVQALGRVAPWLLAAMLVFSLLGALFYSRYITRPIVRLSGISKRMAELDFGWSCAETRSDEIGVLGRSLDELSERLSAALGELQEANAALRRDIDRERELERQRLAFFSAVSHELKTPITILKGQLSGMLEGVDVYRDRDRYLARSLQVTGRMETMVQEILTVSRMESGGFTLRRQSVDLLGLLERALGLYQDLIEQKGLTLERDLLPGAEVSADPGLLGKAVDNVLSNAVFYAPEGAAVRVTLRREEDGVTLSVENSGSHIPEEALPHVFEAFYRAEGSRNRRTGGSGLGLYLVDMILSRHGAAYRVENTPEGVRFTIVFPDGPPSPHKTQISSIQTSNAPGILISPK